MHFSLLPIELYLTVKIFDPQPLAHHTKARSFMPTRCLMEKAESLQMLVVISMKCPEEKNGCRRLQILQIHYTIPALPIPTCQQHSLSYTSFLFLYLLPILQKHRGRHVMLRCFQDQLANLGFINLGRWPNLWHVIAAAPSSSPRKETNSVHWPRCKGSIVAIDLAHQYRNTKNKVVFSVSSAPSLYLTLLDGYLSTQW